jgi:phosphogluconate dehydratase
MSDLSDAVPLLARVYPNGVADVNHFHAAGGMGFLIRELLDGGYLHEDVKTVFGTGLSGYAAEAKLIEDKLVFEPAPAQSGNPKVLATLKEPFQASGGLKLLNGNLGRSVIKVSAVKAEHRLIEAPARIFHSQQGLQAAFKAGELNCDVIAVVRFAGPKALGMPELHNLTPALAVLQGKGYKVALVTDGRMSGASGKVPAAIHLTPEAVDGGPISKLRDGDLLRLDADAGTLEFLGDEKELLSRTPAIEDLRDQHAGTGRELFAGFRRLVTAADQGAKHSGSSRRLLRNTARSAAARAASLTVCAWRAARIPAERAGIVAAAQNCQFCLRNLPRSISRWRLSRSISDVACSR